MGALILFTALITLQSCQSREEEPTIGDSLPPVRSITLSQCGNVGAGSQDCSWEMQLDPSLCSNEGCRKLVIFFSGGQMTCPTPGSASFLDRYQDDGYVAVCARLFENSTGSGEFPYHQEAGRVNRLIENILSDPIVKRAWTEEFLLISGISHGATAPAIAMANGEQDNQWRGTDTTGACFIDGIYQTSELFSFLDNNSCAPAVSVLSYRRAYERYCNWTGGVLPITWPAPSNCQNINTQSDTIVARNPNQYAVKNWKLIECGSGLGPCAFDVTPANPIAQLCNQLESSSNHQCDFQSIPQISHVQCGIEESADTSCRRWFNGIIGQP